MNAQDRINELLFDCWKKSGITKMEFARRLGTSEVQVRRMLNAGAKTKLPTLDKAFKVLGYHLVINTEDV